MKTLIAVLMVAFVAAEQKREAEPSIGLQYPLVYPYGVGLRSAYGLYPYGSHSFHNAYTHAIHKRDADPDPGYLWNGLGSTNAYGYGLSYGLGHNYGYGYPSTHFSYHTVGKREADPGYVHGLPAYGAAYGHIGSVLHPGIAHSYQYNHAYTPAIYG
ncbi:shematrin-like protein 1 [Penaeus japonicus]|uniref:shematrin-like protein 1 n=1 Tax=Penaeus japonicus TaxID=27405 RepID=UPI001C710785|nr:shematrin-like protein 1 [Penaeus japonicus]